MRTERVTLFHALVDGRVVLPSLVKLSLEDLRRYHWFDENSDWTIEKISLEVPHETGWVEMWDGGDETEWPHVHYPCRHCGEEHNFDLDEDTLNPWLHICCKHDRMDLYTLVSWKIHKS